MGRRRRKVIKVIKRKLPKVFNCPNCGVASFRVTIKEGGVAKLACGSCGLTDEYTITGRKEIIDIYNEFVDKFMAGRV